MLKGGYTHISRSFYEKKLTHLESQIVELRAEIFGMVLSGISSNFDFCRALDRQLSGIVGLHAFDVSDELDWSQEDARKWVNAVGNRRGKSSTMMNFVDTCSGFCATLLKKRRMKLAQGQQAKLRRRVTMARQRSTALKRAISSGSNSGNKGGEMPAGENRNTDERAPSNSSNSQHSPPPAERQTAPNTHAQHHSPQPARNRTPSPVPAPIRFNRNGDGPSHQKVNNSARWTNSSPNINGEEYGQKSPEFERTEMYNRRSPPPKSPDVLHRQMPSPHRSTHKSAPPENGRRKSAGRKESERNETETSNTDSWSSTDAGMGEPKRGRSRGPKRRSTTARRKQMNGVQGASTSAGVSPTNAEHIYANGISSSSTDAGKKSRSTNTRSPSTNVSPRKSNFKDGSSEQLSGIGSANWDRNREAENENEEDEEEDELSPLNRLHRRKGMSKRTNFTNPSMKKSDSFSFHNQT